MSDDQTEVVVGIGAGAWDDLTESIDEGGRVVRAALLPVGTRDGNPTVELLIRCTDGRLIHANTTWRLWQAMTNVFGAHQSTWEVDL